MDDFQKKRTKMKKITLFFIFVCILYCFAIIGILELLNYTDKKTRIEATITNSNEDLSLLLISYLELVVPQNEVSSYSAQIALFGCNLIACLDLSFVNGEQILPLNLPIGVNLIKHILYKNTTIGLVLQTSDAIWVIFRGTQTVAEWRKDLLIQQVDYLNGKVHKGFLDVYLALNLVSFLNTISTSTLYIFGHSLGGALSLLLLSDPNLIIQQKACYLFGTPRIGNNEFGQNLIGKSVFRIVNRADIVNDLPPTVSPNFIGNPNDVFLYQHNETSIIFFENNQGSFIQNHALKTYLDFLIN